MIGKRSLSGSIIPGIIVEWGKLIAATIEVLPYLNE